MDYGVHLPLMDLGGRPRTLRGLLDYAEAAEDLGFRALSANDHLRFPRPWLDGPTALAAVLAVTQRMDLVTTVALPVVRGPVPLAKSLAAIDLLSGGRLVVGVGPGSSARHYAAVGVPFEERWKRLDEAAPALRTLLESETPPFEGEFYSTQGLTLEPYPARIAPRSGSAAGVRRPVSGGRPGWATAGSPPPTTPRRRHSRALWGASENTSAPMKTKRLRAPSVLHAPERPSSTTIPSRRSSPVSSRTSVFASSSTFSVSVTRSTRYLDMLLFRAAPLMSR
jgi:alkanesulfonate monooxygenase SsuD/methylene tetrahydromethanopterin reductase-like flavin-dependent oxidoreductase (luciferase family)